MSCTCPVSKVKRTCPRSPDATSSRPPPSPAPPRVLLAARHPGDRTFAPTIADGKRVPLQTWATAHRPDGSLKWTAHAAAVRTPPQLAAGPADLTRAEVFGGLFAPADRSTPAEARIETVLTSPSTATSARPNSAVGTAARPRRTPCPSASAPTGAASPRSRTWRSSATSRRGSHAVAVR
ncbi:RIFT barrel domain-containing protein [Streptomyces malaysiensis]|uniref:RIFT barrel domain-containing protein n=1 Tax=Streptomyces malaysiensis TaxID=92644 RepID=UPI003D7C2F89